MPIGNSTAEVALKYIEVSLKGLRQDIVLIILLFLSKNNISMGKRIKKVCIELQGSKIRAWPFFNSFLPKSPFILIKGVLAIITSLATTEFLVVLIIFMIIIVLGLPIADLWSVKDIIRKDYASKLQVRDKRRHIAGSLKISQHIALAIYSGVLKNKHIPQINVGLVFHPD